MELLIEALIAALEQAGLRAVKAFPQGLMPHLEKDVYKRQGQGRRRLCGAVCGADGILKMR